LIFWCWKMWCSWQLIGHSFCWK